MALRVIDIAWPCQDGISIEGVDCDAVIVKATGGNWFTNPKWREWADRTLGSGKLLGLYHYCMEDGVYSSPEDEARHFLDTVGDYARRAAIFLDWEADAQDLPVSYARRWLDIVAEETGATPFFYAYAYYLNSRDHSEIAKYPLWMASYLDRYGGAGWVEDPANIWGTGSWERMTAYQYTSTGHIGGYGGDLDLSVFYGDRGDWLALAGGRNMVRVNEVAAAIHRHMCECPKHGYTQGGGRWGQGPNGPCYVEVGGRVYEVPGNDFDCSSSVKKAWELALQGSPYEGAFGYNGYDKDGAWRSWYTGNEIDLFCGSGLFSWEPMSFIADTGDLYLNVQSHVAMCQTQVPDVLSEFYINEYGTTTGGQVGDQTGGESWVRAYYSFPWDGILHYNGSADYEEDDMSILTYKNPEMNGDKDVYQLLTDSAKAVEPHDSAAGDGTYGSMPTRVDWIDMRVREMREDVAEIKAAIANAPSGGQAGLGQDEIDAIAEALADKLAKRIAD